MKPLPSNNLVHYLQTTSWTGVNELWNKTHSKPILVCRNTESGRYGSGMRLKIYLNSFIISCFTLSLCYAAIFFAVHIYVDFLSDMMVIIVLHLYLNKISSEYFSTLTIDSMFLSAFHNLIDDCSASHLPLCSSCSLVSVHVWQCFTSLCTSLATIHRYVCSLSTQKSI